MRLLLVAVVALLAVGAASASAVVPPRDCGTVRVKGVRYDIKADQLRCSTARDYSTRFLRSRTRPRGYRCDTYRGTALRFKCVNTRANPDRTFFAIKR